MKNRNLKVVTLCGSLRINSYNRKLLELAKTLLQEFNVIVEDIDLKKLNLPIFDEDIEVGGFPESVVTLKSIVESADLILIATPEYNHSISGALKNALDWLSRKRNSLNGKTAVILGASTGLYGTMRAQIHLRQILTALNVTISPQPQIFISSAHEAFNEDRNLKDSNLQNQLKELIKKSINIINK